MYKYLLSIIFFVLVGCDNTITNNSGALPSIDFTGTVWAGNVRFAKVQLVGITQYGQADRESDGEYAGDSYYTDELGQFSASIRGSYSGSLLAVASYADYDEIITPATDAVAAVTTNRKTQFRCVLPSGCGTGIDYGSWYDAPADFEMWGAVSSVDGLENINITPVTHLAAKQAFNQSVLIDPADPTDVCNDSSCIGSIPKNNILTPETIFQGNHRVKQFFLLNSGLHVNVTPWYEGIVVDDSTVELESAKHGLLAMALQKFSVDRSETVVETLNWWVTSFLEHDGNFYVDGSTDAPNELDATKLFQAAVTIENNYDGANKSNSALAAAQGEFAAALNNLTAGSPPTTKLLPFVEVVYDEQTADKILKAQELVAKVQGWALNLESPPADGNGDVQYSMFFDAEVAKEITDMEDEWALYNQKLSPVMKSFFKPIIKVAEYGLLCIRTAGCDTSHDLDSLKDTLLTFTAESKILSLINASSGVLTLDGQAYAYNSINLAGELDEVYDDESGVYKVVFSFTHANIKTVDGTVELSKVNGILPSVVFWLNAPLTSGSDPVVVRIDVDVPNLNLESETTSKYQFDTKVFEATLIGTRDSVSLITDPTNPYHFNILSANIEGKFSDTESQSDSMDLRFTLNSENAATYYSPTRFPDIEMSVDSTAFKNYTKLEAEASGFISDQGGWFTLPANITLADNTDGSRQVLTGDSGVKFFDRGVYGSWFELDDYKLLAELLDLSYSESARLGTLSYPGGETALVIFKTESDSTADMARQCTRVDGAWGCQAALPLSSLGCGAEFSNDEGTIIEAFNWLESQGCISQVKLSGRGVYDIDYSALITGLTNGDEFNITLKAPEYLGIQNFYVSLISRFVDGANEARPTALMIFNGAAPDLDNVSLGFSLTHGYQGGGGGSSIGLDGLIPYGKNSIWLAVGRSSAEQDALVYYIQDSNITMTVFGFDYADAESSDPSHDKLLAVIRYDGQLLGSLRKEGNFYVIRYIDGTWQLL